MSAGGQDLVPMTRDSIKALRDKIFNYELTIKALRAALQRSCQCEHPSYREIMRCPACVALVDTPMIREN